MSLVQRSNNDVAFAHRHNNAATSTRSIEPMAYITNDIDSSSPSLPSFQHDLSSAVSSFYTPLMLAFLVDSLLLYMKSCFTLDTVYMIFIYMLLYKRVRDRDYYRVPIILAEKYHLWGKQSHLWGKKNNGITISSSTGSEYRN
jgi:hypothetical protein